MEEALTSAQNEMFVGRVTDIILNSSHPKFPKYGEWNSIGTIFFEAQGNEFVGTVFPQILLTNSHDGKNSFQFQAGLYRLICSNGLVIADTQFEAVKIRHMGILDNTKLYRIYCWLSI